MAMIRFFLFAWVLGFLSGTWAEEAFILDDMSKTDVAEMSADTVYEGTYEPCMRDAYAGQFHHDWAKAKGRADLTYHFDPPEDGCYRLEEYHPGGAGNTACSRYLPSNAKLHVEYCVGQSASVRFNQAERGAQWNRIGEFPFYKGHMGRFTMSNSPDEECSSGSCFWVADALRLTRIGEACQMHISGPDVRYVEGGTVDDNEGVAEDGEADANDGDGEDGEADADDGDGEEVGTDSSTQAPTLPASVALARGTENHDGTLRLSVRAENAGMDVQAQLEAHSGDVETALSLYYGGVEVDVLGVFPVSSHRRLSASSTGAAAFDITFKVQGGSVQACTTCPSLQESLQQGLRDGGADLTIEASTVSWRVGEPVAQTGERGDRRARTRLAERERGAMVGLGLASLVLISGAFAICWRLRNCRKTAGMDANVQGTPVETDAEVDAEKGEKGSDDNMRDDASTATPTSEENHSLGDVELEPLELELLAEGVHSSTWSGLVVQPVPEGGTVVL